MSESQNTPFRQRVEALAPKLAVYFSRRLHEAEFRGWIPERLYEPDDLVDELLVQFYQNVDRYGQLDERTLRRELFRAAYRKLQQLLHKEAWHQSSESLEELIREELKTLEEHMTADGDGDLVFVEEIDDVSYRPLEQQQQALFDREPVELPKPEDLIAALELDEAILEDREAFRHLLQIYLSLPELTRHILDLVAFGGLSPEEVAEIQGISKERVVEVLAKAKARFKRRLPARKKGQES